MSKLVTQFVLLDEFHFDYNEASQNGVALFIFDKLIQKTHSHWINYFRVVVPAYVFPSIL